MGPLTITANRAACAIVRSRHERPNQASAAASTPRRLLPSGMMLRYVASSSSLLCRFSSERAWANSRSLVRTLRSAGQQMRMIWLVIVEAPVRPFLRKTLPSAARARLNQSTPPCDQKRRSSTSTTASGIQRPISERRTGRQNSPSSDRVTLSSAPFRSRTAVERGQAERRLSTGARSPMPSQLRKSRTNAHRAPRSRPPSQSVNLRYFMREADYCTVTVALLPR